MAHENRRAALIKKHSLKGVNKPKRTPSHKTKSHVVSHCEYIITYSRSETFSHSFEFSCDFLLYM